MKLMSPERSTRAILKLDSSSVFCAETHVFFEIVL